MTERVTPGWNNNQNWGNLPKLKFPPVLAEPPRATVGERPEYVIVVCVCVGPKFPAHYVTRMKNMVARNLTISHDFFVVTDRINEFEDLDINTLPVKRPELPGWYSKINLFNPRYFGGTPRVLYFDLDVVIKGNIDSFASCVEPFVMIREFNATPNAAHNSSVMSWIPPYADECYDMPADWMERSWGDQECIWLMMGNDRIWDWPHSWVQSYKYHGRAKEPTAPVIVFHGDPKPDCVTLPWVVDNWQ